jgi:hypothetical protein
MPRFYLNVVARGAVILDDEGTDLHSLEEAHSEALLDARALMSDAVKSGIDISRRAIQICDSDGRILMTVPFTDALREG